MTEAEWEASEDPGAMLDFLTRRNGAPVGHKVVPERAPGDRELRLFIAAGLRVVIPESPLVPTVEAMADNLAIPEDRRWWPTIADVGSSARTLVNTQDPFARPRLAHLLRDIIGNPFRPVAFLLPGDNLKMLTDPYRLVPAGPGDRVAATVLSINGDTMRVQPAYSDILTPATPGVWPAWRPGWLTPTVRSLAQAAYEERTPGSPHKKCRCGREFARLQKKGLSPPLAWCNHCAEDGGWWADAVAREPDGTLDSARLAVLADALEEAGCCEPRLPLRVVISGRSGGHEWEVVGRMQGEEVMRHTEKTLQGAKRWAESNLSANGWERWGGWGTSTSMDWQSRQPCLVADGLAPATIHPILAHLRSPGPHVRGCWPIDLLTGKE